MFRCWKFKLFLLFSSLSILLGSQYSVWLPCSLFSDTELILLKTFILLDLCFSATCVNLIFLLFTVYINSSLFKLENGRNSLVQMMQNHLVFFPFWRSLYVLLVYFVTFTINLCATSITLSTLMIFSNRSIANFRGKFYYHFY